MTDLPGWILDTGLKALPAGSDGYLLASFILSLFYFLALAYDNKRLKAPYFIEWVRMLLHSFLIFISVILVVIVNHTLTAEFLPVNIIDTYAQAFLLCLIALPFAKIVLKTYPTKEVVFKMGYEFSLLGLGMVLALDFGAFGGQLIRTALGWAPTYSSYLPVTGLLCLILAFIGIAYAFFFIRLEKTFLQEKEQNLSDAVKQPARLLAGLVIIFLVFSFIFAALFYNDYTIREGTPTYVSGYLGDYPGYGSLEKVVNGTLHKNFFFKTPFEGCEGWNVTGDVGNESMHYINATTENFTVTCTKQLDRVNATLTQAVCSNADNNTVCNFSMDIVDVPFRFVGRPETIRNLQVGNISCSRIEVKERDSLMGIYDVPKDVKNDYAAVYVIENAIAALRIDYDREHGLLLLDYLATSKPAQFNVSVSCQH